MFLEETVDGIHGAARATAGEEEFVAFGFDDEFFFVEFVEGYFGKIFRCKRARADDDGWFIGRLGRGGYFESCAGDFVQGVGEVFRSVYFGGRCAGLLDDGTGRLAVAGDFETGVGGQAQGEQGGCDERKNFH